jgi:hypothetical protein
VTNASWKQALIEGQVIPACPLALEADGTWSERHQRGVLRYYVAAGAGGIAVGVHSTQFAIRDPKVGLYRPLLELAAECLDVECHSNQSFIRIAGVCGDTAQAVAEARLAQELGFHAGLVSLTALAKHTEADLLRHLYLVSDVLPIVGFYLQPSVGGRVLSHSFWRSVCEIPALVAIKIAPFNRYQTWDVVRAVMESGRRDVALYTGNDDNIIIDLLTPWKQAEETRYIVGGLLGQWGVWTKRAVELLNEVKSARKMSTLESHWLSRNVELTDANAAIFDAANQFRGCIPGINELLRRSGLLPSNRCLDPDEVLSPGQAEELDRVVSAYPHLTDTEFIHDYRDEWLR